MAAYICLYPRCILNYGLAHAAALRYSGYVALGSLYIFCANRTLQSGSLGARCESCYDPGRASQCSLSPLPRISFTRILSTSLRWRSGFKRTFGHVLT